MARWFAKNATAAAVAGPAIELIDALNDRDPARMRAVLAPDAVVHDRRRTGMGLLEGAEAYIHAVAALWELTPDIQFDVLCQLALEPHGVIGIVRSSGTLGHGGGAFERVLAASNFVAGGVVTGMDLFELDDLEAARAYFAERRPDPLRIPPNAAKRTIDRVHAACEARDWDVLEALCAPDLTYDDRRRASATPVTARMSSRREVHLCAEHARDPHLARRPSERLALERVEWREAEGAAPFEIEALRVTEVDAEGRMVARILFDAEDRAAARREIIERQARIESWPEVRVERARAGLEHDLARMRAALPEDFVYHDHRRTGPGRLECRDDYVEWMRALFEQSPDAFIEPLYTVAARPDAALTVSHTIGTLADGGAFENVFTQLSHFRDGRFVGVEIFELGDLERVRASLVEPAADHAAECQPDPLRIPANAAKLTCDRGHAACDAKDWETYQKLVAPDAFSEDRRRGIRTTLDREQFIENAKYIHSRNVRATRTLLCAPGDRLALERIHWHEAEGAAPFEIDALRLTEVDTEGRIVARINFDPDDRRAARREMIERGAKRESWPRAVVELLRAQLDHDVARIRAALPDDFVYHDHRHVGPGRLECADDFVGWIGALFEQSPDAILAEPLYLVARTSDGTLSVCHTFGTLADGGGAFESVYLQRTHFDGDRFVAVETYELEELERLRAEAAKEKTSIAANAS
jgi:ketosteroid isomerase-like protein